MLDKLHASELPHATHEHEVLHEGDRRESAEFKEEISSQKNPLIAVWQAKPAHSQVAGSLDGAIDRPLTVDSHPKTAGDESVSRRGRPHRLLPSRLRPAIGVQEKQHIAARRRGSSILLNGSTTRRFDDSCTPRRDLARRIGAAAVRHNHFNRRTLPQSLERLTDVRRLVQCRNDDGHSHG
jgi:hypothetical protein